MRGRRRWRAACYASSRSLHFRPPVLRSICRGRSRRGPCPVVLPASWTTCTSFGSSCRWSRWSGAVFRGRRLSARLPQLSSGGVSARVSAPPSGVRLLNVLATETSGVSGSGPVSGCSAAAILFSRVTSTPPGLGPVLRGRHRRVPSLRSPRRLAGYGGSAWRCCSAPVPSSSFSPPLKPSCGRVRLLPLPVWPRSRHGPAWRSPWIPIWSIWWPCRPTAAPVSLALRRRSSRLVSSNCWRFAASRLRRGCGSV